MRGYMKAASGDIPFFQVLGNHEQEMGFSVDDNADPYQTQPIQAVNARRAIFPNPKPDGFYSGNTDTSLTYIDDDHLREDYYAFTWGDALFIALDPYWYTMTFPQESSDYPFGGEENPSGETRGTRWDWSLGIQQYLWLKDTLATSTATYKFVFIHNVTGGIIPYGRGGTEIAGYFEWGGKNWDDTWGWDTHRPAAAGWTLPIHQLMDQYNVSIFFHGHDHFYAKQELDGIVYQEVPMPAAVDNYIGFRDEQIAGGQTHEYPSTSRMVFYGDATKYVDSGHLRVTVAPTGVTVDYVDMVDGSITATYTIPAPGQTYNLTTAVAPAGGGTIVPSAGVHSYSADSGVDVTATPASGYVFDHWSGACTGSDACSVTMDANKTVTANFVAATTILGDVTGDGLVNSTDALIVLSGDVGVSITQYCPANCGDVNGDTYVNSTDALIILSYDVGMSVQFPVGQPGCPASVNPCLGCIS
jgi:Divergent InlB B-repeat domain